jgi:hypothetical protein
LVSEFIVIDLLDIHLQFETLLGVLAGTGLLIQLLHQFVGKSLGSKVNALPHLATFLMVGSTVLGLCAYGAQTLHYLHVDLALLQINSMPTLFGSMVVAAAALAFSYYTGSRQTIHRQSLSLAILLIAALGISLVAPATWHDQCVAILGLCLVSIVIRWKLPEPQGLGAMAHLFAAFWLITGLPHLMPFFADHVWMACYILTLSTLFYLLAVVLLNQRPAILPAAISGVLLGIHLFAQLDWHLVYKMGACALAGAAMILSSKLAKQQTAELLSRLGQVVFFIATLATMLLGVQTLVIYEAETRLWPIISTLLLEALLASIFYQMFLKQPSGNLFYACSITNIGLAGVLVVTLMQLPDWRKFELASIGVGLGMLVLGMKAWYAEMQERHPQPNVSPLLLLGSLLVSIPMVLVVMGYRSQNQFMILDEAMMLILGVVLLGLGCLCQLRIPAISGAALTMIYLLGLLLFFPWGQLGTASLVLAGGGAGLFLLGLGLSIFRDRLLALPQQVKEHRGIFQVLGWR